MILVFLICELIFIMCCSCSWIVSPRLLDANLRVEHEMYDLISIAEVQLRFVSATLKEAFGRLDPIRLDNLRLNTWCESAQHLVILEHFHLRVDCGANLQTQHHCIVNFELDSDASPRALLESVLLLD